MATLTPPPPTLKVEVDLSQGTGEAASGGGPQLWCLYSVEVF